MSYMPQYYYIHDINIEIDYDKNFNPNYAFNFRKQGQMKLLMNEIRFLSEDVEISKNYKNKNINILYIGSGKGYHIPVLIDMYSTYNINWYLYDPTGHCDKLYNMEKKNKNIKIHDTIFNKSDVEKYESMNNLLFISDIRTIDDDNIEPTTKNLIHDYDLQNYILKELRPISLIKQRDPFPDDWDDSYKLSIPDGKEYIQCFQKYDSAEYRIFISGITTFTDINADILNKRGLDRKLAWYNMKYRFKYDNDYKIAYRILNKYMKTENKPILKYNHINKNNISNIIKSISMKINNN
ncbi:poly(A) polymerase small subunit VP39 [Choristoneura biennis entomopoxvirus]|uniref:Cap-specific mRNA (nucleoside-2'-O-)-methyltransferase n=1 Tax=Choristoneura biennis entomopoxvirus TaxID=10288 RepID=A0A916KPK0_CBEPV|nr:poly(A) polymerase small subunit VP39 [Choristoneura biennis entomopoxvirus]CCU55673.1 poly(A) polymerase small subunit VP39 [Choristoneura biennis entomopoxvirus]